MSRPPLHTLHRAKADGQELVDSISADKADAESHRPATHMSDQVDGADQEINCKTKIDLSLLEKKLGPSHVALIHALKDIDPASPYGRELASIIESLDPRCV